MTPVYLDHHATTPCDPRVVEAMIPYLTEVFGNPSAISHPHGRAAAAALERARFETARFFGVQPEGVIFTAGATESNNLALGGLRAGDHVITSKVEHQSILAPLAALEQKGTEVTRLDVDSLGFLDPEALRGSIREETRLVTIGWANGEIGTIESMEEISKICRDAGVVLHSDATQAVGKIPVDSHLVDALSLSAHKIYGPKGVGALICTGRWRPSKLIRGGGQEKGLRSGTVNVPGAVGLAKALELRTEEMEAEGERLADLRDGLARTLSSSFERVAINGPAVRRLPGNLSVRFEGIDAEALMGSLRGFSLSSGAACSAGSGEPSHVLKAIGLSDREALETIRIGLGSGTEASMLTNLVGELDSAVARARSLEA